jgi:hypothetical protein
MNTVLHTDTYVAQHGYNCPVSLSLPLSANEPMSIYPTVSDLPLSLPLCLSPSASPFCLFCLFFLSLFSLSLPHSVSLPLSFSFCPFSYVSLPQDLFQSLSPSFSSLPCLRSVSFLGSIRLCLSLCLLPATCLLFLLYTSINLHVVSPPCLSLFIALPDFSLLFSPPLYHPSN